MGQKGNPWAPQVLVYFPFYQTVFFRYPVFLTHNHFDPATSSRWPEDHGQSPGLELLGLEIYGLVVERCKAWIGLFGWDTTGLSESLLPMNKPLETTGWGYVFWFCRFLYLVIVVFCRSWAFNLFQAAHFGKIPCGFAFLGFVIVTEPYDIALRWWKVNPTQVLLPEKTSPLEVASGRCCLLTTVLSLWRLWRVVWHSEDLLMSIKLANAQAPVSWLVGWCFVGWMVGWWLGVGWSGSVSWLVFFW